jgi:DNA-binding transcriptional LysR family regulator
MTLKQLEAFYWAATCSNFALAAERLHLSTSSLSKRISELEESLEVQLFDRSAHKAALSEAGQDLLPHAAELLMKAEDTRRAVSKEQVLTGRCAFGVGELSALTWLPRLAPHMRKVAPGMFLEPQVDIGTVLEERLRDGSLDCAVVAGRSSHHSVVSHTIAEARFVWVTTSALALADQDIDGSLLAEHPLVTLPPGAGTTRILDDWLMKNDLDIAQRFTCNSWGAIAGLLIEGFGIGILPEGWARTFAHRKQLQILSSSVELASLIYTFQHRRHDDRRVVAAMHAAVKATADFSVSPRLL